MKLRSDESDDESNEFALELLPPNEEELAKYNPSKKLTTLINSKATKD